MKKQWEVLDERIIIQMLVSPQTGTLVTLDFKGFVKFWDLQEARVEQELASVSEHLRALQISPDENRFCVVSLIGSRFYKKVNNVFRHELFGQFSPHTCALKFASDSTSIIFAPGDQRLVYKDLTTNAYFDWENIGDRCAGLTLLPDSDLFAASACCSAASRLLLLKFSDAEYRKSLWLEYDELTQPTFSNDGKWLAVGHWIPVVYAMEDVETQKQDNEQENLSAEECWFASPRYLFDLDGQRLSNFERSSTVNTQQMWTRQLFEMNRNVVIAGSPQGKIFMWNLTDGSIRSQIQAHEGKVFDIALSLDGNTLISCGEDKHLRAWNLD